MKKILLIDNTFDPPHGSPEIQDHLRKNSSELGTLEITVARAPDCGIPEKLEGFHGAVLSGSKTRIGETELWIEKEMEAIRRLHALKIPTFGICYGEQLIARTLAGERFVGAAQAGKDEHGWVELETVAGAGIFQGLPQRFYSFAFHRDEVKSLPDGFRLTASSALCPVQAFELKDAPFWGVQFHPERGLEAGNRGLDRRSGADPSLPVLNREKGAQVFDPQVARAIFRNFLRLVWGGDAG